MTEDRHQQLERRDREAEESHMNAAPETYWIHVVPRKRTGETVTLLVTLAILFLLLILLLGHPKPPPHPYLPVPAHSLRLNSGVDPDRFRAYLQERAETPRHSRSAGDPVPGA